MMDEKKLYCVGVINKEMNFTIYDKKFSIPLKWSKEMIGAIPVFGNKEAAENFAKDRAELFEIGIDQEMYDKYCSNEAERPNFNAYIITEKTEDSCNDI
jgi:c-di-AMP phosphodiesterase-like protein